MNENCRDCIFWVLMPNIRADDETSLGQCRAHSPATVVVDKKLRTRWPVTRHDDCCGDHSMTMENEPAARCPAADEGKIAEYEGGMS